MAARIDPDVMAHLEWLGFVQPTGLVVSPHALVRAGAVLDRRDAEGQRLLRECVAAGNGDVPAETQEDPVVEDFEAFARAMLGWSFTPKYYAGMDGSPVPDELERALPEYGDALAPDLAVRQRDPADGESGWQLLINQVAPGIDFDGAPTGDRDGLEASPHGRLERLLRATGVPAGLLFNGRAVRLISAPYGESSGWLDFPVAAMTQTAGRPISTALRLLLSEPRLLTLPRHQRLTALLEDSRKFQNEVSEKLAQQVLHALYELLRGFQAAHDASGGQLLRTQSGEAPAEVYPALLTVILRLVFLLYAEEREMLPSQDQTFGRYYSLAALHDRLRAQAAEHPDTMDQRYGAWAQLLALFRMVHDGADVGGTRLPARHGVLFNPDRFPFLEGRPRGATRQVGERLEPPLVPDGTVFRALDDLLVLDGERISYRALDVEQIGSVYETMMGFRLELAQGRSLAIRSDKRHGAPACIDLEALIDVDAGKRVKWVKDNADRKLSAKVTAAVREAGTIEALHAALAPVSDRDASPDVIAPGAMVLQPSEERRRSGSHYTPRALTEPIVRTALEPVLASLGEQPTGDQILDLKVCDPAMGSGAFLVEACRQLGDALVDAWSRHDDRPELPPDEDEVVFARRLVAQRCLYGVDRNPVAVDLAKMSLWLITLAREHALTFVDHALRNGDSLVGLSQRQIESFHWDPNKPQFVAVRIGQSLARVAELRAEIRDAGDDVSDWTLRDLWDEAQDELAQVRLAGDLVVVSYFAGSKAAERKSKRDALADAVTHGNAKDHAWEVQEAREGERPLAPFHWPIELPEVFDRERPGFDAIVGNPPFAGKNTLAAANPEHYPDWLKQANPESHGNADLVAHFFRRAFDLLRPDGALGLIATNTIGQGDTRWSGLRWICNHGGEIYRTRKRVRWPGMAAVVVSVVHVFKGVFDGAKAIDGREVETITAFLFHRGGHENPATLAANAGQSFIGSYLLGMGFTFDDTDKKGVANSLADRERLIAERPENQEVILPYIGGEEVNDNPAQAFHRYTIDFYDRSESECRERWPELMEIVEARVRPERRKQKRKALRERWWQYAEKRPGLHAALQGVDRVLATNCGATPQYALAFQPTGRVFAHKLVIFPLETEASFCALQSRPHEIWARFFSATLKDDLQYAPSDCFETFPFPDGWQDEPQLEQAGQTYYDFRAGLMVANDEGLTKTYNRFHDPDEADPEIATLRDHHAAMDRAVLTAYGWDDIPTECEFLLDYEVEDDDGDTKRKKPYRYRWPDEVRDEVLVRLIELNHQRAAEEQASGTALVKQTKKAGKPKRAKMPQAEGMF